VRRCYRVHVNTHNSTVLHCNLHGTSGLSQQADTRNNYLRRATRRQGGTPASARAYHESGKQINNETKARLPACQPSGIVSSTQARRAGCRGSCYGQPASFVRRLRVKACSQHTTELTCKKSTQLHDAFIGCSETRTVRAE